MTIVFVLLPLSMSLALIFLFLFIKAARGGQFDDVEDGAQRILDEDG